MHYIYSRFTHTTANKGFSLIELIVVVFIISILASILLAAFSTLPTKASNNASLSIARTIYSTAAASEATNPGTNKTIEELVESGLLESNPGSGFILTYGSDGITVTYPIKPSGTKTYPE